MELKGALLTAYALLKKETTAMKRLLLAALLSLAFSGMAFAHAIEPTMYEAPTELTRLSAVPQAGGGGHSTALSWVLSTDDTTTACTTGANCLQNAYRAPGSCSTTSSFTLLTTTALSATATTFTDTTVTPGVWCYGVTFGINGLESAKDTVSVTLQPASPTGAAATAK
jgi:hypothetical protein